MSMYVAVQECQCELFHEETSINEMLSYLGANVYVARWCGEIARIVAWLLQLLLECVKREVKIMFADRLSRC